ncbi:MAG: FtsQ-type POTRA domain-containing protein [Clostridia bacterium]|nr:FtsQ-type POTRA domain-containing protein [Clostridia bacterium]
MEKQAVKKKRRKKRASHFLFLYIALGLATVITLTVLSLTVFFHIDTVKVAGDSMYSSEQIITASQIKKDVNIFTADLSSVNDNICKALPYIESVKINRVFPTTIKLTVTKAEKYVQVENGGKYTVINKSGKCLEISDVPVKGIPVLRGISLTSNVPGVRVTFKDTDCIEPLNSITDLLDKNEIKNTTVINLKDLQDVFVTVDNRVVLKLGSTGNLDKKLQHAALTLEKQQGSKKTGILNLSRIPNDKHQAYFTSCDLLAEQIADVIKK